MKISKKLSVAGFAAAVVFGQSQTAHAIVPVGVDNGTYTFTATNGDDALNGSSVTFLNERIVSWDLLDSTTGSGVDLPPLTPLNSSIISQGLGADLPGPNAFSFDIGNATFFFLGTNDEPKSSLSDGGLIPVDPPGVWNLDVNVNGAVPDACSSLELLGGSVTALGACASFIRRRSLRA